MKFTPEQEELLRKVKTATTFEEVVALVDKLPVEQRVQIWSIVIARTFFGGDK